MKPYFSVIIVNFNLSGEVKGCINSFLSNEKKCNYEIIVVDNASTEVDANFLPKEFPQSIFPQISFYFLEENRGFGAGNNFGVSKAKGEIIFLLNPDALFIEEILSSVEDLLINHEKIGVLGTKIVNKQNTPEKSCGVFPSLALEFLEIFLLKRKFEEKVLKRKMKAGEKTYLEVDWVTGSSMFIPKRIYNEVCGFDENFFLYNEEVDLCYRIKQLGYEITFYPSVQIKHFGSVGSKKNYYLFTKYSYESKLIYLNKHFFIPKIFFFRACVAFQIIVQIIIWSLLMFKDGKKSKEKLRAFGPILLKTITNR